MHFPECIQFKIRITIYRNAFNSPDSILSIHGPQIKQLRTDKQVLRSITSHDRGKVIADGVNWNSHSGPDGGVDAKCVIANAYQWNTNNVK